MIRHSPSSQQQMTQGIREQLRDFWCARHLNCVVVYLSFNKVLLMQTSSGNFKLHSAGNSCDGYIHACGQVQI